MIKLFKRKEEREKKKKDSLSSSARRWLIVVMVFSGAVILTLSLFEKAGFVGDYFQIALKEIFGWGRFVIPIILFLSSYWIARQGKVNHPYYKVTGSFISFISVLAITSLMAGGKQVDVELAKEAGGGYAGVALYYPLIKLIGYWGTVVILFAVLIIGLIVLFDGYIDREKGKDDEKEEDKKEDKEESMVRRERVDFYTSLKGVLKNKLSRKEEAGNLPDKGANGIRTVPKEAEEVPLTETPQVNGVQKGEQKKFWSKRARPVKATQAFDKNWKFPPLNILDKGNSKAVAEDIKSNSAIIRHTLQNFGISVEITDVNVGPTVTQYAVKPAEGTKLSKITALQKDLAMSLAAESLRIEAPIPGKASVGIEIPNKTKRTVMIRELLESQAFRDAKEKLLLAFGEDSAGNYVYADLAEMPHLLIAGATGSGKSIGINCLITSLIYRNSPKELKFIMVDPKRVELPMYNDIPHLLTPVIVEPNKVSNVLKWAVSEMDRRYRLIQDTVSRNIDSYNKKVMDGEVEPETDEETGEIIEPESLPYIVILIDELADLMISSLSKEIEASIVRLAQMARAVGIHLVLSTQRPSVNVITGIIKANFPTRIAFQVVSQVDSRTILDMAGAEKLLGKGDMLYLSKESNQPRRIQGAYVGEKEVKKYVKHLKSQELAVYDPNITESRTESKPVEEREEGDEDELYAGAKRIVTKEKKASTSLLQRHLRIGYSRAARLMDELEKEGIVGPAEGSRPRQVIMQESEEDKYDSALEDQAKRDKWEN